jgi:hypothetical protein
MNEAGQDREPVTLLDVVDATTAKLWDGAEQAASVPMRDYVIPSPPELGAFAAGMAERKRRFIDAVMAGTDDRGTGVNIQRPDRETHHLDTPRRCDSETFTYAQLKAIASGQPAWPSAHAETLARVVRHADGLGEISAEFGESITDGDTAAAVTVTDGPAQFLLVCVPVTPEMAAEAARRHGAGVPATVQVTVDLVVGS